MCVYTHTHTHTDTHIHIYVNYSKNAYTHSYIYCIIDPTSLMLTCITFIFLLIYFRNCVLFSIYSLIDFHNKCIYCKLIFPLNAYLLSALRYLRSSARDAEWMVMTAVEGFQDGCSVWSFICCGVQDHL